MKGSKEPARDDWIEMPKMLRSLRMSLSVQQKEAHFIDNTRGKVTDDLARRR